MSSSSDAEDALSSSTGGKCVFGVYLSDKKFGSAMAHLLSRYPYTTAEEGRAQRRKERRMQREGAKGGAQVLQAVRIHIVADRDGDVLGTKFSTARQYRVVATAQRSRWVGEERVGQQPSREDELVVDPATIRFVLQKATEDWGSGEVGRVEALRQWCEDYNIALVEALDRVFDISMRRSVAIDYLVRGGGSPSSSTAPSPSSSLCDKWSYYVPASFTAWSAGTSLLLNPITGTGMTPQSLVGSPSTEGGRRGSLSVWDANEVSQTNVTTADPNELSRMLDGEAAGLQHPTSATSGLALTKYEPRVLLDRAERAGAFVHLPSSSASDPFGGPGEANPTVALFPYSAQQQRVFVVKPEIGCGHPVSHCHNLIPAQDLKRVAALQFARVFQDLTPFHGVPINRDLAIMGPVVQECVSLQCLPTVYKVYVAGDLIDVKTIDAAPMNDRVMETLNRAELVGVVGDDGQLPVSRYAFTSTDKRLFTRDAGGSLFPTLFNVGSPERRQLAEVVAHLRGPKGLGIDFFGIDVLVGLPTSLAPPDDWVLDTPKYIVDVNYMPGYKGVPEEELFANLLRAAVAKAGVSR